MPRRATAGSPLALLPYDELHERLAGIVDAVLCLGVRAEGIYDALHLALRHKVALEPIVGATQAHHAGSKDTADKNIGQCEARRLTSVVI